MPIQPADLARDLFNRLERVAHQGVLGIPDELELRRLELKANALLKSDRVRAHQILGGIAAIRWDVDGLRHHHDIGLESERPSAYANYATSLQLVGLFPDAMKHMETASRKQPQNLTYLRTAADYALWAGFPNKSMELEVELKKRSPDKVRDDAGAVKGLLEVMDRNGVDEKDLRSVLATAFDLLRVERIRFPHIGLSVDGEQDAAFITIFIDRPVKDVLKLDSDLGRLLAEQLPDLSSAVIVQLEPHNNRMTTRVDDGQAARPT